jgi:integrase/recombinase XerD
MEELNTYPEVEKWLAGQKQGTKANYSTALKAFVEYSHLNPTQLIDLAEEDRRKSRREQGQPELLITKFSEYLINSYQQKARGGGREQRKVSGKIGLSQGLMESYCGALQGFFRANGFALDGKRIILSASAHKDANNKLQLRKEEISKLFHIATSIRDKAIILMQYQSFLGVGEVCRLNYGNVQRGLEAGEEFIVVDNFREKRKVAFKSVFGPEAIEMLKLYLASRRSKGEVLRYDSPLFIKEARRTSTKAGKEVRIRPHLIEKVLRELALKSGLVSAEQMEVADLNPARPHSLRSSGMTVAKLAGMPEIAVEFMSGHTLKSTDVAYWQASTDELKKLYAEHYAALRVIYPVVDQVKVRELEGRVNKREDVIDALIANGKNKDEKLAELTHKVELLSEESKRAEMWFTEVKAVKEQYNWLLDQFKQFQKIAEKEDEKKA